MNYTSTTHYQEEQKFDQWWMRLIFLLPVIGIAVALTQENKLEEIIPGLIIGVLVVVLLFSFKLTVQVKNEGINIKFFPLQQKFKHIGFNEIVKIEGRTYSPIKEFGGWGIRMRKGTTAYSVSGNHGVELTLTTGKKILIGSLYYRRLESMALNRWNVFNRDRERERPAYTTAQNKIPSAEDIKDNIVVPPEGAIQPTDQLTEIMSAILGFNKKSNKKQATNKTQDTKI